MTAETARWYRPFILPNTTQVYDLRDPCPFLFLLHCNSPNMSSHQGVRTQLGAEAMSDLQEDVTIQVPIKNSQTPKLSQRHIKCMLRSTCGNVQKWSVLTCTTSMPRFLQRKQKKSYFGSRQETPSPDYPLQSAESRTSWNGSGIRVGGRLRPGLSYQRSQKNHLSRTRCVGPEPPVPLTT